MYDIFYVSKKTINDNDWNAIRLKYPTIKKLENVNSFDQIKQKAFTKMFWVIWDDVILDDSFDLLSYRATEWDDQYVHIFLNGEFNDGICLFPKCLTISNKEFSHRFFIAKKDIPIQASKPKPYDIFNIDTYEDYKNAIEQSSTEMFWIIPAEVTPLDTFKFDMYFSHHNVYDRNVNHVFKHLFRGETTYNGIMLMSTNAVISKRELEFRFLIEKKEYDIVASTHRMYDIVFISYYEPNADQNYQQLLDTIGNIDRKIYRINGIKGIHQAHIEAAKLATTDMFWVVDGDAQIVNDFNFDYVVSRYERNIVHVWKSQNPVNSLIYGYGGVKLLPRNLTLAMDVTTPDMTTSISKLFKAMPAISNITAFNTDPFNSWKSAFRECVKLSSKAIVRQDDIETQERLDIWCTVGTDQDAINGACAGREYGTANKNNLEALQKINDFDWLKEKFNEQRRATA